MNRMFKSTEFIWNKRIVTMKAFKVTFELYSPYWIKVLISWKKILTPIYEFYWLLCCTHMNFCNVQTHLNHYMKSKSVLIIQTYPVLTVFMTPHNTVLMSLFIILSTILNLDMSSEMTPHMDAEVERDHRGQREHFSPIYDWLLTTGSLVCLHLKPL